MEKYFKRFEKKYLVDYQQLKKFKEIISKHTEVDNFGVQLIQNIYFDNDDWGIVRNSIEKPLFKEKFRLRFYGVESDGACVFVESKKKFEGIVYKRRVSLKLDSILKLGIKAALLEEGSQIAKELQYFVEREKTYEKMFLSYKRKAYKGIKDESLRITFDFDIKYRLENFNFSKPEGGTLLLGKDLTLIEIKNNKNFPLWLVRALSENNIFATSFSKYGRCFMEAMAV